MTFQATESNEAPMDLGPKPWNPGNGLIAEDVLRWAVPMARLRAQGVSHEDIAAQFNMPAERVVATLLRFAHALSWDITEAGFTTDLDTLDSAAWSADEARSDV